MPVNGVVIVLSVGALHSDMYSFPFHAPFLRTETTKALGGEGQSFTTEQNAECAGNSALLPEAPLLLASTRGDTQFVSKP